MSVRDMELKRDNEEINAEKLIKHQPDHILKCDECAYSSETEIALKKHMKTEHEVQCTSCSNSFAGNKKLKNHICKVHVENPTYKEYYMKEWFERDKCIRVFNNNKKEEVIILHSEDCTDISKCADLPENLKDEKWRQTWTYTSTHIILYEGQVYSMGNQYSFLLQSKVGSLNC